MNLQLEDVSDEEYFDDPIKLFDLEHDRVHFGSHAHQYGSSGKHEVSQSVDFSCADNAEVTEALNNNEKDSYHGNCLPVSVKLVDCKKYPWYFKKYTREIISKLDIYELVSDSDDDIVVENLKEYVDYQISKDSENICGNGDTSLIQKVPITLSKSSLEKRRATLRLKEDFELKLALTRKNSDPIDYKRNKGLIGMTITQKTIDYKQNKGLIGKTISYTQKNARDKCKGFPIYHITKENIEQIERNDIIANKSYIRAANKTLNNCGTELIPIPNDIEECTRKVTGKEDKSNYTGAEKDKNKESDNVCIQFHLGQISGKVLPNIITNKIQLGNKPNISSQNIQEQKLFPTASKCFSKHVKNIKKTNKYKKGLRFKENSILCKLKETIVNKEKSGEKNGTEANDNYDLNCNKQKAREENTEPLSPILPCSKFKKNKDFGDKSNTNEMVTNIADNLSKKENEQKAKPTNFTGSTIKPIPSNEVNNNKKKLAQRSVQMDTQTNNVLLKDLYQDLQQKKLEGLNPEETHEENNKEMPVQQGVQADTQTNTILLQHLYTDVQQKKQEGLKSKETHEETNKEIHVLRDVQADTQTNTVLLQHLYKDLQPEMQEGPKPEKAHEENNKTCSSSNKNEPSNNNQLPMRPDKVTAIPQDGSNNTHIKIVSVTSIAESGKYNHTNSAVDKRTCQSIPVVTGQSNPTTRSNDPSKSTVINDNFKFNLHKQKDFIHKNTKNNTTANNNTHVNNSYASNIVLTPHRSHKFQSTSYKHTSFNDQHSSRMPALRPPCPPIRGFSTPYNGAYNLQSCSRVDQRFIPRFANSASPNYRFPPPFDNGCRLHFNPIQIRPFGTKHSNEYTNIKTRKDACPRKMLLYHDSETVSQNQQNCLDTVFGIGSQSNNTPQMKSNQLPVHISQPENLPPNYSLIDKPTDINKKKHVRTKLVPQQNDAKIVKSNNTISEPNNGSHTIETKEAQESAAKNKKREGSKNYFAEPRIKPISDIKRPKLLMSQPPETVKDLDHRQQIEHSKGYSPPILPIPTYEKIMGQVTTVLDKRDGLLKRKLNDQRKNTDICAKKTSNHKPDSNVLREDAKKISLEEYKKRTFNRDIRNDKHSKSLNYGGAMTTDTLSRKWPPKFEINADRFSTESDLGYDSDSTVIL